MKTVLKSHKKFHNKLLIAAKSHYATDEMLIKGKYGEMNSSFKGCSIGCLAYEMGLDYYHAHKEVSKYYKFPTWLAYLQDRIFESLPDGENRKWHVELAERIQALPPGASWKKIKHRVHMAILSILFKTENEKIKAIVYSAYDLHKKESEGIRISKTTWLEVETAAWSAVKSAESASESTWSAKSAVESTWLAAKSVTWSAESAVKSVTWSAESAAYQKIRVGILEAIK